MNLLDAMKKARVTCPHCQAGFDLGPDFQAITTSATKLVDSLANFLDGPDDDDDGAPFESACDAIVDQFDVSPSQARGMLESALDDDWVVDAILQFLEERGTTPQ